MAFPNSQDLLIECSGCGIENLIGDFTSGTHAVCNQCRNNLLNPQLPESHSAHVCDECGLIFVLSLKTNITVDESNCPCGSKNLTLKDRVFISQLIEDSEDKKIKEETEGSSESDFDWCRPSQNEEISEDYNDIFDKDPSF